MEHVRPMFELAWMPLLAAVSVSLRESNEPRVISACLSGLCDAIKIACAFEMETQTQTFVSALARFSFLTNVQEMRAKNYEAVQMLLFVAYICGNFLGASWIEILRCISKLEYVHSLHSQNGTIALLPGSRSSQSLAFSIDTRYDVDARSRDVIKSHVALRPLSQSTDSFPFNGDIYQNYLIIIDRIFTASAKLNANAMVDFVRALTEISWNEISTSSDSNAPRLYSLQRLVEVAYYNMNRIRVEWAKLWVVLGDHFNKLGCHPNEIVAFAAIDALRQMAMQFLEKDELAYFRFQEDFLQPYVRIFQKTTNVAVKEMILRCIQQIIQARAVSVKSGWKALFRIIRMAADDTNGTLKDLNFFFICFFVFVSLFIFFYFFLLLRSLTPSPFFFFLLLFLFFLFSRISCVFGL